MTERSCYVRDDPAWAPTGSRFPSRGGSEEDGDTSTEGTDAGIMGHGLIPVFQRCLRGVDVIWGG